MLQQRVNLAGLRWTPNDEGVGHERRTSDGPSGCASKAWRRRMAAGDVSGRPIRRYVRIAARLSQDYELARSGRRREWRDGVGETSGGASDFAAGALIARAH